MLPDTRAPLRATGDVRLAALLKTMGEAEIPLPATAVTVTLTGTTTGARDAALSVTLPLAVPAGRPDGSTVTVTVAGEVAVPGETAIQEAEEATEKSTLAPETEMLFVCGPLPCSAARAIDAGLTV